MKLLDADICIDILRGHPPAVAWLATANEVLVVGGTTVMELVEGCNSPKRLRELERFVSQFRVEWPEPIILIAALDILATHRLTCGLDAFDAINAATVIARDMTLNTFNVKHYRTIPGLKLEQPYQR